MLHGRVLGRHAERVPSHGMKHVEALCSLVTGEDVAHGVVARVANMDTPRRVGEHLKHVAFRPGISVGGVKDVCFLPDLLPMLFPFGRVVSFSGHAASIS